ncbi:MAG: hypothetical protein MGF17_09525 [Trichodesmium sp. MAG_R04]|nr:hypothetical protein [Trichodesmium sp. MAG_R04]
MTLKILKTIPGKINHASFLKQVANSKFDLGGIAIDFTQNRTQSSDLVLINIFTPQGFQDLKKDMLRDMFQ